MKYKYKIGKFEIHQTVCFLRVRETGEIEILSSQIEQKHIEDREEIFYLLKDYRWRKREDQLFATKNEVIDHYIAQLEEMRESQAK